MTSHCFSLISLSHYLLQITLSFSLLVVEVVVVVVVVEVVLNWEAEGLRGRRGGEELVEGVSQ